MGFQCIMKYFRILFLLLVFPLVSAAPPHKFYVSITKIEYVKEKNSLQIITKIFTDDLEKALRERYGRSLTLTEKKETAQVEEDLKNYLLEKIDIRVNGKPVTIQYLGKEYDVDMLVAYLEVTPVEELHSLEIKNTVLMQQFPEQQNIIHLKTPTSRKSLILDRDEQRGKLNFD